MLLFVNLIKRKKKEENEIQIEKLTKKNKLLEEKILKYEEELSAMTKKFKELVIDHVFLFIWFYKYNNREIWMILLWIWRLSLTKIKKLKKNQLLFRPLKNLQKESTIPNYRDSHFSLNS